MKSPRPPAAAFRRFLGKSLLLLALAAPANAQWKPVDGAMMTAWGRALKPDAVWQEYPRPQMERQDWTNLNGLWDYAVTPKSDEKPAGINLDGVWNQTIAPKSGLESAVWAGKILVPFCPESALSGVGRLIEPGEALWYRREIPGKQDGKRTILNFEAVDYTTTVWLNGRRMGDHTGGFTPFAFDITPALKPGGNELVIRVEDATEGYQMHGKQRLKAGGIWYTRVTGIWQTVWLENVPERFIRDLDFSCDIKAGTVKIEPKLSGPEMYGEKFRVTASIGGKQVASVTSDGSVTLEIPEAKLWSPIEPNLYDLKVELLAADTVVDEVKSYTALRQFGKAKDRNGNWRFTLNGKSIFHWGPLDQGWWPDGLLTPPSEAAMISDIDFLKSAGFNMIRKHIKIEPRRYYAHCDRVGMLMWQDQVSQGYGSPETEPKNSSPPWTRMAENPKDGEWPDAAHEQYVTEYKRMVDELRDHPCIAVWSPFNEAWGQHRTLEVGIMAVDYDKTRPINIASGGNFWAVGDIADEHAYPDPAFPLGDRRFTDFIKVVGEFGGHGMPIEGHLWNKDSPNWGYGGLPKDLAEWKQRYARSIHILARLRTQGISAGVYTQTTDVEVEINGLRTYDRINKVDPAFLRPLSEILLSTPDAAQNPTVLPTADKAPGDWQYTTESPADGWESSDFDAAAWKTGKSGFGTEGTPNAKIGTTWDSADIWLRRDFDYQGKAGALAVLRLYHDDGAQVFLNGVKIADLEKYTTGYEDHVIFEDSALKQGRNVIAIHCHQDYGGQFIDAGLDVFGPE